MKRLTRHAVIAAILGMTTLVLGVVLLALGNPWGLPPVLSGLFCYLTAWRVALYLLSSQAAAK